VSEYFDNELQLSDHNLSFQNNESLFIDKHLIDDKPSESQPKKENPIKNESKLEKIQSFADGDNS